MVWWSQVNDAYEQFAAAREEGSLTRFQQPADAREVGGLSESDLSRLLLQHQRRETAENPRRKRTGDSRRCGSDVPRIRAPKTEVPWTRPPRSCSLHLLHTLQLLLPLSPTLQVTETVLQRLETQHVVVVLVVQVGNQVPQ